MDNPSYLVGVATGIAMSLACAYAVERLHRSGWFERLYPCRCRSYHRSNGRHAPGCPKYRRA